MALPPLDVNHESLMSLAEVSELAGADKATVWRWVHHGNSGVLLAARKIGGRWMTSKEAFQRFCDEVTARALGHHAEIDAPRPLTVRQRDKAASERHRLANRGLRMLGFDGGGKTFENSTASKELLCDLHEYLEEWLPTYSGHDRDLTRSYRQVLDGLFGRAAEILEGKRGKSRSLQAAIAWVDSIDLRSFDVGELPGVGPLGEAGWAQILRMPGVADQIRKPKQAESKGAETPNQD